MSNATPALDPEETIERFMPLIHKITRQWNPHPDDWEDLVQAGRIGVLMACRAFDPSRGNKPMTLIYWYILGYQKTFLRGWNYPINVPANLQEQASAVWSIVDRLTADLEREPTDAEILAAYRPTASQGHYAKMTAERLHEVRRLRDFRYLSQFSYDSSAIGEATTSGTVNVENIPDRVEPPPMEDEGHVAYLLSPLKERDARVVHDYISGGRTFQQIADAEKLSKQRIQQIYKYALVKLREYWGEDYRG